MKHYIVRNIANTTLYWNGEKFQQTSKDCPVYDLDEALQEIEAKDIQQAELLGHVEPVFTSILNNHFGI